MGCAPEVATHLERMQPASAPPALPHKPAAMAGALLKPSKPVLLASLSIFYITALYLLKRLCRHSMRNKGGFQMMTLVLSIAC